MYSKRHLERPIADNSDLPECGGQDHDPVMIMPYYKHSKRSMERPIADNSDRPKSGRQNQDVYCN